MKRVAMKYSDQSYHLRIELDTKHCELTDDEIKRLEHMLDPLRKPVEKFPVANLYITIEFFQRSHEYRVKMVLRLPGQGLATGDLDAAYYPALERCVRKLLHKLLAYEDELGREEDRVKHLKGTRHEVNPTREVDLEAVREAFEQNDYAAFRTALFVYEEPIRKRIGRWIQ